jgi:hypothetical protein
VNWLPEWKRSDMDLIVLAIAVGFFAASWAVVGLLDRL